MALGRLLTVAVALVAVVGVSAVFWTRSHSGRASTFESQAGQICREQLAAIKSAADFQTALGASRTMRTELSGLTPPSGDQSTFDDWMLQLRATEDAALQGDSAAVQQRDLAAQYDARKLGLAADCITTRG